MVSRAETSETPTEVQGIEGDAFCPHCGYNLRGLTDDRCPECGEAFDAAALSVSQIPWTQRRHIGPCRAYWRTVWMVTFRRGRFCEEFGRPVEYIGALHFRWLTVMHAYIPWFIAGHWLVLLVTRPTGIARDLVRMPVAYYGTFVVVHVCLLLLLVAITGSSGWLFHPRGLPVRLQNRGVAMSLYACAPLAYPVPVLLLTVAAFFLGSYCADWIGEPLCLVIMAFGFTCFCVAVFMVVSAPVLTWLVLVRLSHRMAEQYGGSGFRAGVLVPLIWLLWAVLILGGVPLLTIFFAVVGYSFS